LRFNPAGSGANRAGWKVDGLITVPGLYELYAWKFEHPYSHLMGTNIHYVVKHRIGLSGWILADQSTPGDEWIYLGTFEFSGSHTQGVMVTDTASGYVIADAIKLVYAGAPSKNK